MIKPAIPVFAYGERLGLGARLCRQISSRTDRIRPARGVRFAIAPRANFRGQGGAHWHRVIASAKSGACTSKCDRCPENFHLGEQAEALIDITSPKRLDDSGNCGSRLLTVAGAQSGRLPTAGWSGGAWISAFGTDDAHLEYAGGSCRGRADRYRTRAGRLGRCGTLLMNLAHRSSGIILAAFCSACPRPRPPARRRARHDRQLSRPGDRGADARPKPRCRH